MAAKTPPSLAKPTDDLGIYQRMNEALLLGSVRQHQLTEAADLANLQLKHEIGLRQRAEAEVKLFNQTLERRVSERTAQLKAANEELEAFSYSVSHDLRAPLRHVMGFAELLQGDLGPSLSGKSLQYLTTILGAGKKMGNLMDDLLEFSRVGKTELRRSTVNLDELVREQLAEVPDTGGRAIIWDVHPLPAVEADRRLLDQVFVNLISNAVKFTRKRSPAKIEIGAVAGETETTIFIRDNGAGFNPAYTRKLFGVFQRLHSENEFEGTGVGLANVRRIIQRHGGRTWADGAPEQGATFYFSIPKEPVEG